MVFPTPTSPGQVHFEYDRKYYWDGNSWKLAQSNAHIMSGTAAVGTLGSNRTDQPMPLQTGDLYLDTQNNILSVYDATDSTWYSAAGSGTPSATPTAIGSVFGSTTSTLTSLGQNSGSSVTTGASNLLLGDNTATPLQTGSNNTILGFGTGSGLSSGSSGITLIGRYSGTVENGSSLISNGGGNVHFLANSSGAWSPNGTAGGYGTAGQVLTSQGPSDPPSWTTISGASSSTSDPGIRLYASNAVNPSASIAGTLYLDITSYKIFFISNTTGLPVILDLASTPESSYIECTILYSTNSPNSGLYYNGPGAKFVDIDGGQDSNIISAAWTFSAHKLVYMPDNGTFITPIGRSNAVP